jgi:hypothetical protein
VADDPDRADSGAFSELEGAVLVSCPYCGQEVELVLDVGGGTTQEYVEDCEVCCRPWHVRVRFSPDGPPIVELATLDEG